MERKVSTFPRGESRILRIDALLHCHRGQRAWLFGKGPSLDVFPFEDSGALRICVNESLRAVPQPSYFFAHDEGPIRNVAEDWPDGCNAILQMPRAILAEQCGIPERSIFVYDKRYCDNGVRDMEAEAIAWHGSLYGNSGNVHSAVHFCRLIGATGIIMVGFDGSGGYAKKTRLLDGGAQHSRIRQDSIALLESLGIPYEFFRSEQSPLS